MRIVCEKSELQKSVGIVSKAVASKSPVYVLEGILISAKEESITLQGSDGTLSIRCTMEADIKEQGDIVLPARLFSEMLAKFDECELSMYTNEQNVIIECGHSKTTLCYMDASQYPDFPECDTSNGASMYGSQLISMIDQTVFATSISEDKPILTGILVEIEKEQAKLVALDGYRLAIRSEQIQSGTESDEIVVPAKSMKEIARIIPDDENTVRMYFGEKMVSVLCENVEIATRMLQGDYVKYKSILPNSFSTRFVVDTKQMQSSIERASILARQGKTNIVNLNIDGDVLTITSNSEMGQAREQVDISLSGKNLDIAFNSRYLLDVLKEIDDEQIAFDMNTSISPCMIHPVQGKSYLYMVLPVKTMNAN